MVAGASSNSTTEYKARLVAEYIHGQFRRLRDGSPDSTSDGQRPLMISMQGPQGAGELISCTLNGLRLIT